MTIARAIAICGLTLLATTVAQADALDRINDNIDAILAEQAPGSMVAYDASQGAVEAAWAKMPLVVRHPIFVTRQAAGYGVYDERPTNEFKPGEVIYIHAEPIGYAWKAADAGGYVFGVVTDLTIQDEQGNTIFDKPEFAKPSLTSHERNKEFSLNIDVTVTGIKPGAYKIAIKLHDLNSSKTATFSLPFKIAGAP